MAPTGDCLQGAESGPVGERATLSPQRVEGCELLGMSGYPRPTSEDGPGTPGSPSFSFPKGAGSARILDPIVMSPPHGGWGEGPRERGAPAYRFLGGWD